MENDGIEERQEQMGSKNLEKKVEVEVEVKEVKEVKEVVPAVGSTQAA